jgi:hypothetical protein
LILAARRIVNSRVVKKVKQWMIHPLENATI